MLFYKYCIVSDFVLRCTWLVPVFLDTQTFPWVASFGFGTMIGVLELFRRWQWCLIRIENESVNNLEAYRYILDIPLVNDYEENKQKEE